MSSRSATGRHDANGPADRQPRQPTPTSGGLTPECQTPVVVSAGGAEGARKGGSESFSEIFRYGAFPQVRGGERSQM